MCSQLCFSSFPILFFILNGDKNIGRVFNIIELRLGISRRWFWSTWSQEESSICWFLGSGSPSRATMAQIGQSPKKGLGRRWYLWAKSDVEKVCKAPGFRQNGHWDNKNKRLVYIGLIQLVGDSLQCLGWLDRSHMKHSNTNHREPIWYVFLPKSLTLLISSWPKRPFLGLWFGWFCEGCHPLSILLFFVHTCM